MDPVVRPPSPPPGTARLNTHDVISHAVKPSRRSANTTHPMTPFITSMNRSGGMSGALTRSPPEQFGDHLAAGGRLDAPRALTLGGRGLPLLAQTHNRLVGGQPVCGGFHSDTIRASSLDCSSLALTCACLVFSAA